MFAIIVRAVIALASLGVAGSSALQLALISRNPWADQVLTLGIWIMVFGLAAFCALAFALSLSREILGHSGR
jgi:hypothetical protein